ncbi:MAG TPA: glycosyltransferase family 87 protein [Polyangiaceae bacterium]|nr:glycosyltransferase family 87 protein [Polyangiaceae bacterium]
MGAEAHPLAGRLKPGTVQRVLHLAFVLVALVLAVRWARAALPRYLPKDWAMAHVLDALEDWGAARLYLDGVNPYSKAGAEALHTVAFGHPPTALLWVLPLAPLEKPIAAELMSLSTWFLLALGLYICARELRFPSPIALSILLFGWALTTEGLLVHFHAIQSSEQIAFALVVAWVYLRRGREVPAGIALAVAATFKLFPGVLFLVLLLARRFRAFVVACLGFGLAVAVVTVRFGVGLWKEFLVQQEPIAKLWMGHVRNQSLTGAIMRLLQPLCVAPPVPTPKANFIATAIALVLLALAAFASRRALRRARTEDPRAIDVPFALFSTIAVFINPWIWEHYWVLLIQPAFVVTGTLYARLRDTFQDWLDETASHRALALAALPSAVGVAGIGLIAKLVEMQGVHVEHFWDEYATTKNDWAHHQVHLYEVVGTAPWVLMILLCFMAAPFVGPSPPRPPPGAGSADPV